MAIEQRRGLRRVTIEPGEDGSLGHIVGSGLGDISDADLTTAHIKLLERSIMVSLAGCAAEAIKRGRHNYSGAASDMQQASDLALHVSGDGEEASAYVKWLWVRTRNRLKQPLVWKSVAAVAETLLEEKTLGAKRIREIVRQARCSVIPTPPRPIVRVRTS